MQMHEPQQFEMNHMPGLQTGTEQSPALLPMVCLVICGVGWLFVSYWSVCVVAYGISAVKLFPPTFGDTTVMMFATTLQIIPSMLGLVAPFFFVRWVYAVWFPVVVAVCLAIVGFEMYHGVLAQNKTSTGPALIAQETAEIDTLAHRINTASAQIQSAYAVKTQAYSTLADASAQGRDVTGMAYCGRLCRENRSNFATATARYSHLALPAVPVSAAVAADADLRARLTDLVQRSDKLVMASKDLADFYRTLDKSTPPAMLTDEIASIHTAVATKEKRYANLHSLSAATLALEQTNTAFAALSRGEWPTPEARLPMVYGLLPALCVLVLSLFIRVCINALGSNYYGLGHVAAALAKETLASRMLSKLSALRHKNFVAHLRATYQRWSP